MPQSTGTGSTTGTEEPTGSTGGARDPSSTGFSTTTSADDSSTPGSSEDGGETGSDNPFVGRAFSLLLYAFEGNGKVPKPRYWSIRATEEGIEGPAVAFGDAEATDSSTFVTLPEQRVAFRRQDEIHLGALDGAIPAPTIRLDAALGESDVTSGPAVVPGTDSLLFFSASTLYHVESDGESPPVPLLESENALLSDAIDPQGRYIIQNLMRVSLEPPLPQEPIPLLDLEPGFSVTELSLTPSGDGAVARREGPDETQHLLYFDLSSETDPTVLELPLEASAPDWLYMYQHAPARPHPDRTGFLATLVTPSGPGLRYLGVEDGVPLEAVSIHEPAVSATGAWHPWSPDGRWLLYRTFQNSPVDSDVQLARFDDGHEPSITAVIQSSVMTAANNWNEWSPDSQHLYLNTMRGSDSQWYLERISLTEQGPSVPQPIGGPYDNAYIDQLSAEHGLLLYSASPPNEPLQVFVVDVSGDEPGEPVRYSAPPTPTQHDASKSSLSPDGGMVAYLGPSAFFKGEFALQLVDIEAPGTAIEVADPILRFQFLQSPG